MKTIGDALAKLKDALDAARNSKKTPEQIENAKELYDSLGPGARSFLEYIFPEVVESEDERIRKAIIDALYSHSNSINVLSSKGYSMDDVIANLEKQKHSLDFDAISSWLRDHASRYVNSEYNEFHLCTEYDGTINVEGLIADLKVVVDSGAFDVHEQKEQKPQDQCVDVIKMSALLAADRLASAEMTGRLKERKEILENPEKYDLCKPAEWSEEDEAKKKVLFSLIDSIIKIVDKDFLERHGTNREELMDILKSLRPQPHWKPSEEQMLALKYSLGDGGKFDKAALESLYAELKKHVV